jgi:ABC-2 type transport system ATP-binding protein
MGMRRTMPVSDQQIESSPSVGEPGASSRRSGRGAPATVAAPIFISYSHADRPAADALCAALTAAGTALFIDHTAMLPGGSISEFVRASIRHSRATICVLSESSLLSGWVTQETLLALAAGELGPSRRFIAAYLDERFLDIGFRGAATKGIDARLSQIEELRAQAADLRIDTRDLDDEHARLFAVRSALGTVLQRLRESLCLDLREPVRAETLSRIVRTLQVANVASAPFDLPARAAAIRVSIQNKTWAGAMKRLMDLVRDFGDDTHVAKATLVSVALTQLEGQRSSLGDDVPEMRRAFVRHAKESLSLLHAVEMHAIGEEAIEPAYSSTFAPGLLAATAQLREEVAGEQRESGGVLLAFAERYAVSKRLYDDAVLLQMESRQTAIMGYDDELVGRTLDLIDRIVADHTQRGGEEGIRRREQVLTRVCAHYQRQATATATATATVCEAKGISKRYRGSDFELAKFNLAIKLGEITGIVGQNSHGKTTLLRVLAGELEATSGELAYPLLKQSSSSIDWPLVKQHLAFVPQELPAWSGALIETLHYEAALHGVLGSDNVREVHFIAERLGLSDHLEKRWSQLSGGFKLRFALARALVWKPRFLVMDEPLANLDVKARSLLLQDIRDLAHSYRHPIAVIVSSHELHSLESVCDQMVFLRRGEVLFSGSTTAVGENSSTNEYEIGGGFEVAEVRRRLDGTAVDNVREDGVNVLLTTAREIGHAQVLKLLLERGIDVQYFRDNSRSVRRLFE